MDRKLSVLFLVVMLGFPAYIRAQSASGIVAPSRMVNWSNAGVQGGIQNRTSICTTLNPGATASDINSAIAGCAGGGVVFLNAGTYNLSSGIDFGSHSNVTLRGAGANQTFLVFSAGVSCSGATADVCVRGSQDYSVSSPANLANISSGYTQGSTQLSLSNVSNLSVGKMIVIDQLNDSSDTGDVLVCEATGSLCSNGGPSGGERSGRGQQQLLLVNGINGTTVTVSPPIMMPNWRSSQQPQAWWGSTTATGDGIEDMSLDHTNSNDQSGIILKRTVNSWIKNVRSVNSNRNHVWLYLAMHDTILDSYFYGTKNAASQSYGVEAFMSSSNLIENNIFQHITGPLENNGTAEGSVEAYNYVVDDYYSVSSNWMMSAIWMHGAGSDMVLIEGNEGPGLIADDIHGTHNMSTIFRNRLLGWDPGRWGNSPNSGYNQTTPIMLYTHSRYYNIIGNVLGWPGYHSNYEDATPSGTNSNRSVYTLGWGGNYGTNGSVENDPLTKSTLMRWGNYDTATNSVHWDSSEVPSSLSQYGNAVPSSQSLPASFYLSSRPGFWTTPWGTPAWPAIGPDVTGGNGPGGHSYDIPAKLCYDNTSKTNGILNFDANSCYSSSPAPTAPTGLGAVAH